MKNLPRYLYGITLGICGEYLYRVGFCIWPLIMIFTVITIMIIDLHNKTTK